MAVVPVVHRRGPRPAPRAATSAGGDGRGRSLWTHRVNRRDGGPGEGMRPVDNLELRRLRGLAVLDVLHLMAEHTKFDRDFAPVRALDTRRVHVTAAGAEARDLLTP